MNKSDYDKYYKKGGTYVIPIEIFNELYDDATEEIERLNNIINELEKWVEYQATHTMQQHNYYGVLNKIKELKGSELIMGTSANFKIEGYKDIKNYIHNYLGLTKDEVMSIIKETLAKSVREEITKILNDETRLRILINDCISREISNQSKERRCYMHSMMDEIYRKIDEEIHKQVTDRLLISLKESKEDNLESQV